MQEKETAEAVPQEIRTPTDKETLATVVMILMEMDC